MNAIFRLDGKWLTERERLLLHIEMEHDGYDPSVETNPAGVALVLTKQTGAQIEAGAASSKMDARTRTNADVVSAEKLADKHQALEPVDLISVGAA